MVYEGKEEGRAGSEWRFALGFQGRSVGLNGERESGEGGLTRSYLLLRTSDFHWTDASYLRSDLTLSSHLGCSPPYRGGALPTNNGSHIIAFIAH